MLVSVSIKGIAAVAAVCVGMARPGLVCKQAQPTRVGGAPRHARHSPDTATVAATNAAASAPQKKMEAPLTPSGLKNMAGWLREAGGAGAASAGGKAAGGNAANGGGTLGAEPAATASARGRRGGTGWRLICRNAGARDARSARVTAGCPGARGANRGHFSP